MNKMHVKKGDTVVVITGKDKLQKGKVLMAFPAQGRVVVENVAMVTRHQKPKGMGKEGGRIDKPAAIDASNVLLYCKKCDRGVRTGRRMEGDKKVRYCKKCNTTLD